MVKDAFMPHMQALFQKHDFTLAISVLWNADFISLTQVFTMDILKKMLIKQLIGKFVRLKSTDNLSVHKIPNAHLVSRL